VKNAIGIRSVESCTTGDGDAMTPKCTVPHMENHK